MRSMDISNGENIGVSLFVQGCHFHCYNCFNSETWDFNKGKSWNNESQLKFLNLINRPHIKRVSILGGEPLADENVDDVLKLIKKIRGSFPDKCIWLYTGYIWENIWSLLDLQTNDSFDCSEEVLEIYKNRKNIVSNVDVLVDGRYIDDQKDITLKWCGSKNQRVIDVKKSLSQGGVVIW